MAPPVTQISPPERAATLSRQRCAALLADARSRTLELIEGVSEPDLDRVHDKLMSPLVWDLGHIAAFEDLWLCQRAGGLDPLEPDLAIVYDASETPRVDRGDLPYLRHGEALEYMEAVRERALDVLDRVDFDDPSHVLNHRAFVWQMLVQHEHQHNETMLQTLMLAAPGTRSPRRLETPGSAVAATPGDMARVGAGPFSMGADLSGDFTYDNERPLHEVELAAFDIDVLPVTNGQFADFVADGGYARRSLWAPDGWAWRQSRDITGPLYWTADGGERSFDRIERIDPSMPVMYVSWHEADAFARWAGKRLPAEAEWEKAASWDPAAGRKLRFPWGDSEPTPDLANLDQLAFGPAAAGAYPAGASPYGVLGMIGDAWEWTSTPLGGYPGFEAFPYPEYSQVFFGPDYKVLRGGSWATRPGAIRGTFRNWDYPGRRQIHCGFRCARDA